MIEEVVRDSGLLIDLHSGVESCDEENGDLSIGKKHLPSEYDFERDVATLIRVSKQFQADYENEKFRVASSCDNENDLNISILNSNSLRQSKDTATEISYSVPVDDYDVYYFSDRLSKKENILTLNESRHHKKSIPRIPYSGTIGTGIRRPKKHSCVQSNQLPSVKRSHRTEVVVRPYTARYYNFSQTHPRLQLIENGSIIPKRIPKEASQAIDGSRSDKTVKPLISNGLTWHEFLECCNVYSAKSFQSLSTMTLANTRTSTQTVTESSALKCSEMNKIQRHDLPQLIIPAECCVQRIPDVSIAPGESKPIVNGNIKLVEMVYGESEIPIQKKEDQRNIFSEIEIDKRVNEVHSVENGIEIIPVITLSPLKVAQSSETNTSITSLQTQSSLEYEKCDSSLEKSISFNVSRVSSVSIESDVVRRAFKSVSVQTKTLKHDRKQLAIDQATAITPSSFLDCNQPQALDPDNYDASSQIQMKDPQHVSGGINLPKFPTDLLIQMVDEIFDTSSDAVNRSYQVSVKETSVQTEIVWKNIKDLYQQHSDTMNEPISKEIQIHGSSSKDDKNVVAYSQIENKLPKNEVGDIPELYKKYKPVATQEHVCHHTRFKKSKICSCVICSNKLPFSAENINQSSQLTSFSGSSSSSTVFVPRRIPANRIKLLPSVRYQQMKRARAEQFENDPRIFKTLKKIYATARTMQIKNGTSSTSCGRYSQFNNPSRHDVGSSDILQPDLYTLNDEMLLFGVNSSDDSQYSSYLLRTESSQDTSVPNGKYHRCDEIDIGNNLLITNSEENSDNTSKSHLERCLLKDIENSGSDPSTVQCSSVFSTSSLERKMKEIQLYDSKIKNK